ncbi:MAG: UDP-N-acetylmuramoyl-L-alanine--D-glutamate ligase [Candidatus Vogelbacteria bacterium]|nr:UDP-N-acetylmuramoyl-L-alanine--D-glutamate ligase [Candidatus Vogelbacteria bacterium]
MKVSPDHHSQMRLAILGFGREGKSVLKFLRRAPPYRGAKIFILDQKLDKNYLKDLARFDLIFRSPGVPYHLPALAAARKSGVKFSSATKLFFEQCPAKIIGVTGTKGKSTVVTLLDKILRAAGRAPHLVGNIGRPALAVLPKLKKNSLVIFELSSFQLQDLAVSPPVAVILDLFPDHQDSHRSLGEYYAAKGNIVRYQKPADAVFFFSDSPRARRAARRSRGRKIPVGPKLFKLFSSADLYLPGAHNFRNAVMAATVAASCGVSSSVITKVVKRFRGLPHRLQFVRRIGQTSFYDDSAATNPLAAAAALRSFPGQSLVLIAGGRGKGLDYAPLTAAIKHSQTKAVLLFGQDRRAIARTIGRPGAEIILVETLEQAVKKLLGLTKFFKPAVVLLSPGAASFDQFRDYLARGDKFQELVRRL